MEKLIKGLQDFRLGYFTAHQALFEELSQGQNPRVLFITCSDSRVDPNLITQAQPGELFVIRNAGNIVPPFGAANGGEGAAIEYAVHHLDIDQVIICGHSHCGAMKGLLKVEALKASMPLVYDWLKHTEATRVLLNENYSHLSGEELLEVAIAENLLTQVENLRTYPSIRSKIHQGRLTIATWIYHIETGEVLAYDPASHGFVPPRSSIGDVAAQERLPHAIPTTVSFSTPPSPSRSARLSPDQWERIYRGSGTR